MAKHIRDTQTEDAFPVKRGRGRPRKADALTNAERQARFKQKQRDQIAAQGESRTGDRKLDKAFSEGYHDESMRNLVLICMLRLRNSQHAELIRTVDYLKRKLRAAGLDDSIPLSTRGLPYYWNENPPVDYRPLDPRGDETPHPTPEEAERWRRV